MLWIFTFFNLAAALRLSDINMPPEDALKPAVDWNAVIEESKIMLRNHTIDWGKKTKPFFCPVNTYVWGFVLSWDGDPNYNMAGYNRIDLLCYGLATRDFHFSDTSRVYPPWNISFPAEKSQYNANARWIEKIRLCEYHNGPIRSFNMRYVRRLQPKQVESGVVLFEGICWDSKPLSPDYDYYGNIYTQADVYNATGRCENGTAMCGIQLRYQIESDGYNQKKKSIVDIDPYCCKLRDNLDNCHLKQDYRIVANVDNRGSDKQTYEKYTLNHQIVVTTTVSEDVVQNWEHRVTNTITQHYSIAKMQEKSREINKYIFDRDISLMGMIGGFEDLVSGFTGFLKDGLGLLLGDSGLGQLLGVGGIGKLTGEMGVENTIKLKEEALTYFYGGTNFGKILASDPGKSFGNLNALGKPQILNFMFTYNGYGMMVEGVGKVVTGWKADTHSQALAQMVGPAIEIFQQLNLKDIIGLYGLAKIYGKGLVNAMLQDGSLAQIYNIADLASRNWADGVGRIVDSTNLGTILALRTLASLFGPIGIGRKLKLDVILNVDGLYDKSLTLSSATFMPTDATQIQWENILTIYFLSNILGEGKEELTELYKNAELLDDMGMDGLQKILESTEIKDWIDLVKTAISKDDGLIQKLELVGLQPTSEKLGEILSSEEFKKAVGVVNYQFIIGVDHIPTKEELEIYVILYGINTIFGKVDENILPPGLNETSLKKILSSYYFGNTIGMYNIGKIYSISALEKITGYKPRPIETLKDTTTRGRGFFDNLLSSVFDSGKKGLFDFVGGELFGRILGTGKGADMPKNEKTESQKRRLTEEKNIHYEQTKSKSETLVKSFSQEISKIESNDTEETVDSAFDARTLTLILIPQVSCDTYLSVDITERKSHITILIPESGQCDPEVSYNLIHGFNYLDIDVKEKRSYFLEIGTEWRRIHQYDNFPAIQDIINNREPARGVMDRIKNYMNELTGVKMLGLKEVISSDLNVRQVWKKPETFEAQTTVYPFTYNAILQTKIQCHEVVVLSSQPILVRIPKVFGCRPKGVWEPLEYNKDEEGVFKSFIGLRNGGKDVDKLNEIQADIPEINNQLIRMANELRNIFVNTSDVNNLEDVFWKTDASLIRNPAWGIPYLEHENITISDYVTGEAFVSQLVAKCGPVSVLLHKYKFSFPDGRPDQKYPVDLIVDEDHQLEEVECPPHIPC